MAVDQATRVTLVRHGRTAWNALTRIQGQTDIDLDAVGRWQAERVAHALSGDDIDAIYASDLKRARDTAQPTATALGKPLILDVSLRERHFGDFEGRTIADIEANSGQDGLRWRQRDPDFAPQGGESLRTFHDRSVAAFTHLALRHPGQHILVVSHGGVLDAMYRAGSRIDISARRSWHVGNAGIHRMLHADGVWTLVGWNDEFHLEAAMPEDLISTATAS
jgi:2,3-bisphosphoglycerate-dependent phosphoglycerate mutase